MCSRRPSRGMTSPSRSQAVRSAHFSSARPCSKGPSSTSRPSARPSTPDGVTVVATVMTLSEAARRRPADGFGDGCIVMDFIEAPTSTDVLLTHPVSPQLLGHLRRQFPDARVVITEIEDEELGVHCAGAVGRLLDAGVSACLPPRPIAVVEASVHAHLTRRGQPALEPAKRPRSRHPVNAAGPDRTLNSGPFQPAAARPHTPRTGPEVGPTNGSGENVYAAASCALPQGRGPGLDAAAQLPGPAAASSSPVLRGA